MVAPTSRTASESLALQLPEPLRPLAALAFNAWWSWQPRAEEVWRAVDAARWDGCGHNPVRLLREASPETLARAAADGDLIDRARRLLAAQQEALRPAPGDPGPFATGAPIAFLCAEYAIHESLPIYSGGLGALAGDLLKEASDRGLPLVAVGLLYRRGYFHQRLDPSGWQHEYWIETSPEQLPVERALDASGAPLAIDVPIRGRAVRAAVWRVEVGRVPLYLLDTDVPENGSIERFIAAQLYVGDRTLRLMQYALLGLGAVRTLAALGIRPALYHLNEGHPALAALELAREARSGSEPPERALERARGRLVFTTHTPVAAGNETYGPAEVTDVLRAWLDEARLDPRAVLALGRAPGAPEDAPFGMTDLALGASRSANAVSRRHGEVARAMWASHWPGRPEAEVPISYVTNGVHLPTWMAPPMRALLDRVLGPDWRAHAADPRWWEAIDAIPDAELWQVRRALRAELVDYVRGRSVTDRLARGEALDYVERAAHTFDPEVLTLGFARRVASYKRLDLLVADAQRALALLGGPRPIQVVIAGKAHPSDDGAKRMVQRVFALKDHPLAGARVVFLEDHDLAMERRLVAGCDVWVNLPRPPLEASGTSGMKAALNGGLNLSVLDGWWCEGYDGANGWAIRSVPGPDDAHQDARDGAALYELLERDVAPAFYERERDGVPRGWIARVKASLRTIGPAFTATRTLGDYVDRVYRPASGR